MERGEYNARRNHQVNLLGFVKEYHTWPKEYGVKDVLDGMLLLLLLLLLLV